MSRLVNDVQVGMPSDASFAQPIALTQEPTEFGSCLMEFS